MPFVYVAIAGLCIVLHNAVLITADSLGITLWLAVLLSFGIVSVSGYVLHSLFTFRRPLRPTAFARYAVAMSANIPLAFVTTWFWRDGVGLAMALAAPLASACMLALNFVLGRWAIAAPEWKSAASR